MPRYILLVFAILILLHWSVALFGPAELREVALGGAQGTTIGAVVITALAELALWIRRRPRA